MVRCGQPQVLCTKNNQTSLPNRVWFHGAFELFHVVTLSLVDATCTAITSNGNSAEKAEVCNEDYTNAGEDILKNH